MTQNTTSCILVYHLSVTLPVCALLLSSCTELKVFTCQQLILLCNLSLLASLKFWFHVLPSLSGVICNAF